MASIARLAQNSVCDRRSNKNTRSKYTAGLETGVASGVGDSTTTRSRCKDKKPNASLLSFHFTMMRLDAVDQNYFDCIKVALSLTFTG